MPIPAGARLAAVALLIGLVSGCGGAGPGGGASTPPRSTTSASTASTASSPNIDQSFTLKAPIVPGDEPVLLTHRGFGPEAGVKPIKVDGSYTVYAACQGGSEVTFVSKGTKSETKAICSGYTSRLRFLTLSRTESWAVKADKGQEWVFTIVDAVEPK